jgi:hypothetical protein
MPSSVDAAWAEMMASDKKLTPLSTVGFVSEKSCGAAKEEGKKAKKKSSGTSDAGAVSKKKPHQVEEAESAGDSAAAVVQAILLGSQPPLGEDTAAAVVGVATSLGSSPSALPAAAYPPLVEVRATDEPGEVPSTAELLLRLQRPMQQCGDPDMAVRKRALQQLHACFTSELQLRDRLPEPTLRACLDALSKPLLKRFADASEACRLLAVGLLAHLVARVNNLLGVLAYLWPAVIVRQYPARNMSFCNPLRAAP